MKFSRDALILIESVRPCPSMIQNFFRSAAKTSITLSFNPRTTEVYLDMKLNIFFFFGKATSFSFFSFRNLVSYPIMYLQTVQFLEPNHFQASRATVSRLWGKYVNRYRLGRPRIENDAQYWQLTFRTHSRNINGFRNSRTKTEWCSRIRMLVSYPIGLLTSLLSSALQMQNWKLEENLIIIDESFSKSQLGRHTPESAPRV